MQLTRGGEYGLRGVLFLAQQPRAKVMLIEEISRVQDIPESYLAKVFQTLAKAGIVRSYRGAKGGFTLARDPMQITMRQVIEALEGPVYLNVCLIRKDECSRQPQCPIHPVWLRTQQKLLEELDRVTLADLANGIPFSE